MKKAYFIVSLFFSTVSIFGGEIIEGYPEYKMIRVDVSTDSDYEEHLKAIANPDFRDKFQGDSWKDFDRMVKDRRDLLMSLGLWNYMSVRLEIRNEEFVTVFLLPEVYDKLWEVLPSELRKRNQRYKLMLDADVVQLEGEKVYTENISRLKLVPGVPRIRK